MKPERRQQEQQWNVQRRLNREVNQALRDGFVDGKVFRRTVMARQIMRSFMLRQGPIYGNNQS